MIFATVGTQLPFDRLISTLDEWCEDHRETKAFAQIGSEGQPPKNMAFAKTLSRSHFAKSIADCTVIVSHAGMGTIFTALDAGKPIILTTNWRLSNAWKAAVVSTLPMMKRICTRCYLSHLR